MLDAMRRINRLHLGHDALQLRTFKTSHESVMRRRGHVFTPDDLEKPY